MTEERDCSDKYCVVGAGAAGLAVAKNFALHHIAFDVLEAEDSVGGIWNYGKPNSNVYESLHLISSKTRTEYADFPMPRHYPDYPSHQQARAYFRSYAEHFKLYDRIEFNTPVRRAERENGYWIVSLSHGPRRRYAGLIVCSGFLSEPKFPDYPGAFSGTALHSNTYKTRASIRGQRVLIVGAGNSGCDIAVECAQNAARAFLSVRRGYHYIPKYIFGTPVDQIGEASLRLRLPLSIRRLSTAILLQTAIGRPEKFGLPKPDHKLLESHPIVNSQVFYQIGHGRLTPKCDIAELCGDTVLFKDGTEETIDVLIYATGYRTTIPYVDKRHLHMKENCPEFYLHMFHPEYDNLAIVGMIHPDSGVWWLYDEQAKLIARFVRALKDRPEKARRLKELKRGPQPDLGAGIKYLPTQRHRTEVEHYSYARRLRKLSKELS